MVIGAYTHFGHGARVRAHEGTVRIGAKTVIGIRNTVNAYLDIRIGEACLLGDDVYICDFDHRTEDLVGPDQGPGPGQVAGADRRRRLDRHEGHRPARHRHRPGLGRGGERRGAREPSRARSIVGGVPARLLRSR